MRRGLDALPVIAALCVNAVAHGRWWLAGPIVVVILVAVIADLRTAHRSSALLLAGAAGAAIGLALAFVAPPPPGPVPPNVSSPLCAALMALSAYCVVSGRRNFAWVYAWLLAVLSCNVELSPPLVACLAVLAVATLIAVFSSGDVATAGAPAIVAFVVFAAFTAAATRQIALGIAASEGVLMSAFVRLTRATSSNALSVNLPRSTDVSPSDAAVIDLDGTAPSYLRTGVLTRFDGFRWTEEPGSPLALAGGGDKRIELTFLSPSTELPAPAGVRAIAGADYGVRSGWILSAPDLAGRTVEVRSAEETLPEEPPPAATSLPDDLATELTPLAMGLLGDEADPETQASRLARYFAENHEYSLSVDLRGSGHPLAVLIRERRPAFCTYFASAMVALLSARGVPARLVTGYVPLETNALTGHTTIRARDAHAWVEVYVAKKHRYVAYDPTPFRSRNVVLGVREPEGTIRQALAAIASWVRRAFAVVRYTPSEILRSPYVYGAVAIAAIYVFRRRLRRARRTKIQAPLAAKDPAMRAVYADYLTLLKRLSLTRDSAETDEELVSRVHATAGPDIGQAAARFVAGFHAWRFGGAPPDPAALDALRGAIDLFDATSARR